MREPGASMAGRSVACRQPQFRPFGLWLVSRAADNPSVHRHDCMADADDVDGVVEVRPTAGAATEEDAAAERSLRPRSLAEFIGQARVKQVLSITLTAARE